ncbi:MAG: DUF4111 domain-containing protein [Chloroflexi bacterium]|nr:DUF4111 domain-containing protein [Chloroflexota bacterium]
MHPSVQPLLDRIVAGFRTVLGENLVGIYLHGSLALGGFNPVTSDVDFMVVVWKPLDDSTRQAIVALTLELAEDAPAKGLEFSIVLLRDTQDFVHPAPFEFHYSRDWHQTYVEHGAAPSTASVDPDLAAHFTITRRRGIVLYGPPIDTVFGHVPEADYRDSIVRDAQQILDDIATNPVYSILNLCRVLAYVREGRVTSKLEGGQWGMEHLDATFRPLIAQALEVYQADQVLHPAWDEDTLRRFGEAARALLQS